MLDGRSRGDDRPPPWRHGPPDIAGPGAPFQRAGSGRAKDARNGGAKDRLSSEQRAESAMIAETGPDPTIDASWQRIDLQRVIEARFGVRYHERHVGKLLLALLM